LGPGGVKVVNLESPSAAGARLASRPGMSGSNRADVTAAPIVASRVVFNMMLVMNDVGWYQKSIASIGPNGHYKYRTLKVFHAFICHSSDAMIVVSPVRPPTIKPRLHSTSSKRVLLIRCRDEFILA
jgi:hypothetical protein